MYEETKKRVFAQSALQSKSAKEETEDKQSGPSVRVEETEDRQPGPSVRVATEQVQEVTSANDDIVSVEVV